MTSCPDTAIVVVWGERRSVLFRPDDQSGAEDVTRLLRAFAAAGQAILLVDESVHVLTARTAADDPILSILRKHRHRSAFILLTTQHFTGDLPQAALACSPWLHVFRTVQPSALDRLESTYGLDPDTVATLPLGRCLVVYQGFA